MPPFSKSRYELLMSQIRSRISCINHKSTTFGTDAHGITFVRFKLFSRRLNTEAYRFWNELHRTRLPFLPSVDVEWLTFQFCIPEVFDSNLDEEQLSSLTVSVVLRSSRKIQRNWEDSA
jgi:hypothetical protein